MGEADSVASALIRFCCFVDMADGFPLALVAGVASFPVRTTVPGGISVAGRRLSVGKLLLQGRDLLL